MRVLVVYDTAYGNTEKIAKAIGSAVVGDVKITRATELDPGNLEPVDMLIVGSPTQGGRATKAIQDFLAKVSESAIKGVKVAAFDTRYSGRFVKVFGYAAERIANSLEGKGGILIGAPTGFLVMGKDGPLKDGELERAAGWAKEIVK